MNLATLAAIRAIVAVHAQYNRPKLLAAIDEHIERERACRPGTPMQSEEEESMIGPAQMKTGPAGNRSLTTTQTPKELRHG